MNQILERVQKVSGYQALLTALAGPVKEPISLALMRAARLPVLAALHRSTSHPILLITQKTDRAMALFDELSIWLPEASRFFFPEPSSLFYENLPWTEEVRRDRLLTLTNLISLQIPHIPKEITNPIIVAPARALMTKTMPKRDFARNVSILQTGKELDLSHLLEDWVRIGYEPSSTVTVPGQFARRGGILDIWPITSQHPIRVELFGDEIDSLREFSPGSQMSRIQYDKVLIAPAREFLLPREFDHIEKVTEFHLPTLHPAATSLMDYLPPETLILLDNADAFFEIVDYFEEHAIGLRSDYIKDKGLSGIHPEPYWTAPELQDEFQQFRTLHLGPSSGAPDHDLTYSFSTNARFGGQLKPFIEHLVDLVQQGSDTKVVSRQAARLQDVWQENQGELISEVEFIQGILTDGFSLSAPANPDTHLFTDGEIFGWRRPQPRRTPRPQIIPPEAKYADFQTNDLVVHIDHGIGYFKGFVSREIDGILSEYLRIEYAEADELYVPIHQSDRVSRYIGSRGMRPSISRLSSQEWKRVKARVQQAVEHIAQDLLELYAKRSISEGYAFGADTAWQRELEASFPYIETPDQLQVISEVKKDMEKSVPMDRLICGDVGYGKTEIALRAAFKAVMSGKQVAMLVPTTILAQQHFRTFSQRLAGFPVKTEMLSRFRTPSEQRQIIYDLGAGKIDIIIGTHRLIQPDIRFHELGMVIIDEEQRFGVAHKEYLKKLRTEVDVLTLTATPIPRTLYMALTGIRDISTINTPPEERLPINTYVGPYKADIVRRAIVKELERGGQVFFVHNRVQTIDTFGAQISNLVPEARIGIAHGQMAERELEKIMREFTSGEIDVLLSTSIIESGLDIPNANTLIVDRADTFGLAQLYQLRGRVGRGAQRAYAYFFKHRARPSTEEGQLRLETLAENTQLGAGYSIAMRDLEIRGAGDFLGTRQHGQIAAVGLNLYTRLLAQAIKQIRDHGELEADALPITAATFHPIISIDLPLVISIPADYLPDNDLRLKLYRRIADIHDDDTLQDLEREFHDRFGPIPEPLNNLFYQIRVRILAEQIGASSISYENGQLVIRFPALPENVKERVFPNLGPDIRTARNSIWVPNPGDDWKEILVSLLNNFASQKMP
jgi:transcription-repair coupling factor (superfamily II helicase)